MQVNTAMVLTRFSSFQRAEGSLEGCPESDLWLNPNRVKRVASERTGNKLRNSVAFLSYHLSPERLAWIVEWKERGKTKRVYVAGEFTFDVKSGLSSSRD